MSSKSLLNSRIILIFLNHLRRLFRVKEVQVCIVVAVVVHTIKPLHSNRF